MYTKIYSVFVSMYLTTICVVVVVLTKKINLILIFGLTQATNAQWILRTRFHLIQTSREFDLNINRFDSVVFSYKFFISFGFCFGRPLHIINDKDALQKKKQKQTSPIFVEQQQQQQDHKCMSNLILKGVSLFDLPFPRIIVFFSSFLS